MEKPAQFFFTLKCNIRDFSATCWRPSVDFHVTYREGTKLHCIIWIRWKTITPFSDRFPAITHPIWEGVWTICGGARSSFSFPAFLSVKCLPARDPSVNGHLIEEGGRDNDGQACAKYVESSSGDRMETLCWLLGCSHGQGELSHPTPADGSRVSPSLPPFCYFNFTIPLGGEVFKDDSICSQPCSIW